MMSERGHDQNFNNFFLFRVEASRFLSPITISVFEQYFLLKALKLPWMA